MTFVFYMDSLSAHMTPIADNINRMIGNDSEFVYIVKSPVGTSFQTRDIAGLNGVSVRNAHDPTSVRLLEESSVLCSGLRDMDLFERRARKGLKSYYTSERWFKPIRVGRGQWGVGSLPGWVRMLVPRYRRMAKRFVNWVNGDPRARVLAIGIHAKQDFLRMGVVPAKIADWGYFVAPSERGESKTRKVSDNGVLRVLWAGRLLRWKRVGDIERAVALANKCIKGRGRMPEGYSAREKKHDGGRIVRLTIVGDGPEKVRLMELAEKISSAVGADIPFSDLLSSMPVVTFLSSRSIAKVRELMREHDTFVVASDAYEGWGAVVSEALEEGMNVIGTYEAGASATILPQDRLYHAGDVRALARLLERESRGELPQCSVGEWTARKAAERLLEMV